MDCRESEATGPGGMGVVGMGRGGFPNFTDMWVASQWVPVSVGRRNEEGLFLFCRGRKAGFGFLPLD